MKSKRGGKATMAPLELAPLEISAIVIVGCSGLDIISHAKDSFEICRHVGGSKMRRGEE